MSLGGEIFRRNRSSSSRPRADACLADVRPGGDSVMGEREEARRILQEASGRDAANEVLRETLARLKVGL